VGEGQEEADKCLLIKEKCPKLKKIVWDDPKGMRGYDDSLLIGLKEVMRMGEELDKKEPRLFEEMVMKGKGMTFASFSIPRERHPFQGVLLTHYNMLTMGRNLMRVDPYFETDDFVSYLPFAWIGEQMMSISCGIQAGFTLNFLRNLRRLRRIFAKSAPT